MWQPIATAPSGKQVLIHYKNKLGKDRIIKARHITRFTEESNSDTSEEGCDEYDEANDRFTYCEGWWECLDNWEEYGFVMVTQGEPDLWHELPPLPSAV